MHAKVIVASQNPVKIEAVRRAFEQVFPEREWQVIGKAVPSGISAQPRCDAETLQGAENRASAAAQRFPEADFWVGIEGGVHSIGREMFAFAWIVVRGHDNIVGKARSGAFLLPPTVARLVRQGHELGLADDIVFRQANSKQKMGAVGLLTNGLIDRTALYRDAVILALVPFGRAWQVALKR